MRATCALHTGAREASSPYAGKTVKSVPMPIIISSAFKGMKTVDVTFVETNGGLNAEYSWQSHNVSTPG